MVDQADVHMRDAQNNMQYNNPPRNVQNELSNFLSGLAHERTSQTQSEILYARKRRERESLLEKIRNEKKRMKRLARTLQTNYVRLAGLDADISNLLRAVNDGVENDWHGSQKWCRERVASSWPKKYKMTKVKKK